MHRAIADLRRSILLRHHIVPTIFPACNAGEFVVPPPADRSSDLLKQTLRRHFPCGRSPDLCGNAGARSPDLEPSGSPYQPSGCSGVERLTYGSTEGICIRASAGARAGRQWLRPLGLVGTPNSPQPLGQQITTSVLRRIPPTFTGHRRLLM
jgi:hypothetical protein